MPLKLFRLKKHMKDLSKLTLGLRPIYFEYRNIKYLVLKNVAPSTTGRELKELIDSSHRRILQPLTILWLSTLTKKAGLSEMVKLYSQREFPVELKYRILIWNSTGVLKRTPY
ncbi:UPF0538 protein [Galdieria sulphuraria]|nr:UPF0538 protein [Galdieria sulphuraria]